LYPTIGQIERAAGLTQDDTPQAKLDKLDCRALQSRTASTSYKIGLDIAKNLFQVHAIDAAEKAPR
jgi:hypothetical protein